MTRMYRQRVRRKRAVRPHIPPHRMANREQQAVTIHRIIALPMLDRALAGVLRHPRILQWIGALAGLMMVALALRPVFFPLAGIRAGETPAIASVSATPEHAADLAAPRSSEAAIVAVITAYNQASITAAVLGRPDVMAPYLAPDGRAWADVQAEYARRSTRGETHDPTLTRWGVLRMEIADDTVTIETQEQWDDIASVGGAVISSRRGILTRNVYHLRRAPAIGRWLITTIVSTPMIA